MRLAIVTDVELCNRSKAGDEAAFSELLARHDGHAYQVALTILGDNYDDAEDALQNARSECWNGLARLNNDRGTFQAWYLGIVRNCCRQLHRRRQRWAGWMPSDEQKVATPLTHILAIEERSYLQGAVDALPPQQSRAVRLRYLEGCDYSEIATLMGLSESGVRSNIVKGLKNLRERLGDVGELGA